MSEAIDGRAYSIVTVGGVGGGSGGTARCGTDKKALGS